MQSVIILNVAALPLHNKDIEELTKEANNFVESLQAKFFWRRDNQHNDTWNNDGQNNENGKNEALGNRYRF